MNENLIPTTKNEHGNVLRLVFKFLFCCGISAIFTLMNWEYQFEIRQKWRLLDIKRFLSMGHQFLWTKWRWLPKLLKAMNFFPRTILEINKKTRKIKFRPELGRYEKEYPWVWSFHLCLFSFRIFSKGCVLWDHKKFKTLHKEKWILIISSTCTPVLYKHEINDIYFLNTSLNEP